MNDRPTPGSPEHPAGSHFDQRSATYDQSGVHRRVASAPADGAALGPGLHVLDVAAGTGLLALNIAKRVGSTGTVLGIDVSAGMLAEANSKAEEADLRNVTSVLGDAERLDVPLASLT